MHAHLGSAYRQAQSFGHFVQVHVLDVPQGNGLGVFGRQATQDIQKSGGFETCQRVAALVGLGRVQVLSAQGRAFEPSRMVPSQVQGQRVEPGEESSARIVGGQTFLGPDKGVLGHLRGVAFILRKTQHEAVDRSLITPNEDGEGLPIATQGPLHGAGVVSVVVRLIHVWVYTHARADLSHFPAREMNLCIGVNVCYPENALSCRRPSLWRQRTGRWPQMHLSLREDR